MQTHKPLSKFQFHYGTIKSQSFAPLLFSAKYFNSTMVRLKVREAGLNPVLGDVFQFHYGTIKRFPALQSRAVLHISIPLWYD